MFLRCQLLIQDCEKMGFQVSVPWPLSGMGWLGRCAAVSLAAGLVLDLFLNWSVQVCL